jgi:hypothetical protein
LVQASVERVSDAVLRGVSVLKNRSTALTDARDVAITISALTAAERNPHGHIVLRLAGELRRQQRSNGSWNDEL